MTGTNCDENEHTVWFLDDRTGKEKLVQEMFAKVGIVNFNGDMGISEVNNVCNKPLIEPEDWKGLNVRAVGLCVLLLSEPPFNASGITIPGGDIYSSLQTGVVDCANVGNLWSNWIGGYQEVSRYTIFPGMVTLTETHSFMFYGKAFYAMPRDMQAQLKAVIEGFDQRMRSLGWRGCAEFAELKYEPAGELFMRMSPRCQRAVRDTAWKLCDGYAAKSKDFAAMWTDMKAMWALLRPYNDIQAPMFGEPMTTIGEFKYSAVKAGLK